METSLDHMKNALTHIELAKQNLKQALQEVHAAAPWKEQPSYEVATSIWALELQHLIQLENELNLMGKQLGRNLER